MKVQVIRGRVMYNGVRYDTGAVFTVRSEDEPQYRALIGEVVAIAHDTPTSPPSAEPRPAEEQGGGTEMSLKELGAFLETATAEKVCELLAAEKSKPEPRKSAVKMLEKKLRELESAEEDDNTLPNVELDESLIVR